MFFWNADGAVKGGTNQIRLTTDNTKAL